MEKVINNFIDSAARANDWKLVLRYQWVLNSAESFDKDVLDAIMIEKCKGQ
jgi:hypothetical protein